MLIISQKQPSSRLWHLSCGSKVAMHNLATLLNTLHKLNDLQCAPRQEWTEAFSPGEREVLITSLRATLPTSLLGHHDRLVSRGKRSLAPVLNGVCGACQIHLLRGHVRPKLEPDWDLCDHCGVFLEWPKPARTPKDIKLAVPNKSRERVFLTS